MDRVTFLTLFAPAQSDFYHPSCANIALMCGAEAFDGLKIRHKSNQKTSNKKQHNPPPYIPPRPLPNSTDRSYKIFSVIMSFLAGSANAALFIPTWHHSFHPLFLLHRSLSRPSNAALVRYLLIRGISSRLRLKLWDSRLPPVQNEKTKREYEKTCSKILHKTPSDAKQNRKVIERDVNRSVFGSVRRTKTDSKNTNGVIRQIIKSLSSPSYDRDDNNHPLHHHRRDSSGTITTIDSMGVSSTTTTVNKASFEDVNDYAVGGVFTSTANDSTRTLKIKSVETLLLVGSMEWGVGYCQGMDYVAGNVMRVVERGTEEDGEGVEITVSPSEEIRIRNSKSAGAELRQVPETENPETPPKTASKFKTVISKAFRFRRISTSPSSNPTTPDSVSGKFSPLPLPPTSSLDTHTTTSPTSAPPPSPLSPHNTTYITYKLTSRLFLNLGLSQFYAPGLHLLTNITSQFSKIFEIHLPVLSDYFDRIGVDVKILIIKWFQTLFIIPSIPTATLQSIWDVYIVTKRFDIFIKFGLAILKTCQPLLLVANLEDIMAWFGEIPRKVIEGRGCLALAESFEF
ncbi:hypothetical protein TrLO_g13029 [Triparma laevis f. longispina]|uniref:Rab-GAP TBC domain-containing protein n=1 Tax=Triparma laevis f. longispina TaxID=1714387 RepID=A0A9W7DR07_9STRA|nr:hypothetical protein TrLO_g13029 [Triparma laevis f. longispina]